MNSNRNYYAITHKDGDWQNNDAENLEWVRAPIFVSEGNCYEDGPRSENDILNYMHEAMDKAWLCRSRPSDDANIENTREENVARIRNSYPDIPEDKYTNWEDGYWNGVMSALRWVLGEEKDFLDT